MKSWYYLIGLGMLLLLPVTAIAAPAYPGLLKMKQPNGEEISIYLKGDEKVHWMESPDGYSLLYDKDKQIVYATTDETGNMVPSSIVFRDNLLRSSVVNKQLAEIPKKLRYSASQVNTLKEIWNFTNRSIENASLRATTGSVKALCALVQFPDKSMTKTRNEFEQLLNDLGYSADGARGSVKDFYRENSYGQLDLTITVTDVYTAEHDLSYYGDHDGDNPDNYPHIAELAKSVALSVFSQPGINPADYDNDGDGYIDAFHFIYAGRGEESGGDAGTIWAHESGLSSFVVGGGKRLNVYSCSPELRNSSGGITRIGVICHEMGHIFGAPDFYDADGAESGGDFVGTGRWDLMAGGSWNGPGNDGAGASPAHINMYQKIKLGWVSPETLNAPKTVTNMFNSAQNAVAYIYNTSVQGEYFVLENRQKKGFDAYVPGSGLLIYHVSVENRDISSNQVNNTHPQKMYPVCASSMNKIPGPTPDTYGNINSAGCPFPGTSGKRAFTDYTTPAATTWNGANSSKPITEISESSDGIISFKFMQPSAEPVTNFTLTRTGENIQLNWDKPNDNVSGYNIFRNDRLIIRLMGANNTSYTQYNVSPGNHSYCISAYYEQDESARNCQSINIEGNPNEYPMVNNLNAVRNENTVELTWDSPAKNDWVSLANNPNTVISYSEINGVSVDAFSAVVRFTKDDLKNFVDSKLSQVRFYIHEPDCKYTIQVWHPSGLPNINPVFSQEVVNKTQGVNVVHLNNPLTIEAEKELWIGINYQTNPMKPVAERDNGPKIPDRNFILFHEQWYDLPVENSDFNWFIAGYLEFDNKYSVYRDNTWLNDVTTEYYRDNVVPAGDHTYCVSVVYGNRESEQACAQVSFNTGIAKLNPFIDEINVYPNPIRQGDVLTMDLGNDFADTTVSFYSVSGQLLEETNVSKSVFRQKINWEPGVYILQIRKNSQVISRKIIVK